MVRVYAMLRLDHHYQWVAVQWETCDDDESLARALKYYQDLYPGTWDVWVCSEWPKENEVEHEFVEGEYDGTDLLPS